MSTGSYSWGDEACTDVRPGSHPQATNRRSKVCPHVRACMLRAPACTHRITDLACLLTCSPAWGKAVYVDYERERHDIEQGGMTSLHADRVRITKERKGQTDEDPATVNVTPPFQSGRLGPDGKVG